MTLLRKTPLRRSLYRSNTVMGAERVPIMVILLVSATLIFTGLTLVTTLLGMTIGLVGVFGLRAATRVHPQITSVYSGFVKFRSHYPARLRFDAPMPHYQVIEQGQRSHHE